MFTKSGAGPEKFVGQKKFKHNIANHIISGGKIVFSS
jgi:hypothetical protein